METTVLEPTSQTQEIPKSLIYEEIDGVKYYYRGWKQVIQNQKTIEEVMGCSDTQMIIISCILQFLYQNLPMDLYKVGTNEAGLHLQKKNNLASDIVIYDKKKLQDYQLQNKYINLPPRIVIEVDVQAEAREPFENQGYVHKKIDKLLAFGVETVIWYFSDSRKVIIAQPDQSWELTGWDKTIQLFEKYEFSLTDLIEKDGVIKL